MLASRGPVYSTRHEALSGEGKGESIRGGQLVDAITTAATAS
jgi:hypothetical protein